MFLLNDVEINLHDKLIETIWRNVNMKDLSVNVRNVAVLLKQLLG